MTEVYVFHLTLDIVESELVGKRNIQHHCFQDLSFTGKFREHIQRTHHLKSVCNLQHRYSRILRI